MTVLSCRMTVATTAPHCYHPRCHWQTSEISTVSTLSCKVLQPQVQDVQAGPGRGFRS